MSPAPFRPVILQSHGRILFAVDDVEPAAAPLPTADARALFERRSAAPLLAFSHDLACFKSRSCETQNLFTHIAGLWYYQQTPTPPTNTISVGIPRMTDTATLQIQQLLEQAQTTRESAPQQALALAHRAVQAARAEAEPERLAHALALLGELAHAQSDFQTASDALSEALGLLEPLSDPELRMLTLEQLARTRYRQGDLVSTFRLTNELMPLARQVEHLRYEVHAYELMAMVYGSLGQQQISTTWFERAITLARRAGMQENAANAAHNIAYNEVAQGHEWVSWGETKLGRGAFLQALERWANIPDTPDQRAPTLRRALRLGNQARAHLELGQIEQASELVAQQRAIALLLGDPWALAINKLLTGRVQHAQGDAVGAVETLREALMATEALDVPEQIIEAHEALAAAYTDMGAHAAALAHFRRFYQIDARMKCIRFEQQVSFYAAQAEVEKARLEAEAAQTRSALLEQLVHERTHALEQQQAQLAEIERLHSQLREQAVRDQLTGLFNRRYLETTLERELAEGQRGGHPVSIVMIDLDHFKQVNDLYGHAAGDRVLRSFGALAQSLLRSRDVACRYGGEEFMLVLPGVAIEAAALQAEQIRDAMAQKAILIDGDPLFTTISCGVACAPEHGATLDTLLIAVDRALYAAKAAGRNCVRHA